jgi:hypothetical protein
LWHHEDVKAKATPKGSPVTKKPAARRVRPAATPAASKAPAAKKAAAKKAATKKAAAKKAAARKAATRKAATGKAATGKAATGKAPTKNVATKKAADAKKASSARQASAPTVVARRADYGAPVDGFFAKQPAELGAIAQALRALIAEAAPDADAVLKWGMPFFSVDGEMLCAIGGHKAHVNLILPGAPGTYADPDGLLEGEGKTGQHLTLRALAELPQKVVRGWLKQAVQSARAKAKG